MGPTQIPPDMNMNVNADVPMDVDVDVDAVVDLHHAALELIRRPSESEAKVRGCEPEPVLDSSAELQGNARRRACVAGYVIPSASSALSPSAAGQAPNPLALRFLGRPRLHSRSRAEVVRASCLRWEKCSPPPPPPTPLPKPPNTTAAVACRVWALLECVLTAVAIAVAVTAACVIAHASARASLGRVHLCVARSSQ